MSEDLNASNTPIPSHEPTIRLEAEALTPLPENVRTFRSVLEFRGSLPEEAVIAIDKAVFEKIGNGEKLTREEFEWARARAVLDGGTNDFKPLYHTPLSSKAA